MASHPAAAYPGLFLRDGEKSSMIAKAEAAKPLEAQAGNWHSVSTTFNEPKSVTGQPDSRAVGTDPTFGWRGLYGVMATC